MATLLLMLCGAWRGWGRPSQRSRLTPRLLLGGWREGITDNWQRGYVIRDVAIGIPTSGHRPDRLRRPGGSRALIQRSLPSACGCGRRDWSYLDRLDTLVAFVPLACHAA